MCVSLCILPSIHQQLITVPKFHLAPGAMTQLLKWRENNELIWMHLFTQDALYSCISSDFLSEQMWFWLAESWLISGHASSSACRRLFLWGFIKSWISSFTAVRRVGSGRASGLRDFLLASCGWYLSLWGPVGEEKNMVLLRKDMKRARFLLAGEGMCKTFFFFFCIVEPLNPDCVRQHLCAFV